jgi:hypothetical protein
VKIGLCLVALSSLLTPAGGSGHGDVKVIVDGKEAGLAISVGDDTYLPIEQFAPACGYTFKKDGETLNVFSAGTFDNPDPAEGPFYGFGSTQIWHPFNNSEGHIKAREPKLFENPDGSIQSFNLEVWYDGKLYTRDGKPMTLHLSLAIYDQNHRQIGRAQCSVPGVLEDSGVYEAPFTFNGPKVSNTFYYTLVSNGSTIHKD